MAHSEIRSESDSPTSERILLCVRSERDRDLLAETLESKGYTCLEGLDHLSEEEIGLIVADRQTVSSEVRPIRERITRDEGLFLPLLVLTTQSPRDLGRSVREMADELVTMPSTKYEIGLSVGQLLRARSYSRDAARQRDQIAEQEENYRLLAESTADAILVYRDGEILYANAAAVQLFCAEDPEDLRGRSVYSLVVGSGEPPLEVDVGDEEGLSDPSVSSETEFVALDGTRFFGEWRVGSTRFGDEKAVQMAIRDVTRKRERKERLRVLAEAVEQVGDKIVITDADGRIQYVNEAFEQLTGYAEKEVIGKDPSLLNSGAQSEAFYEQMWEILNQGEDFRDEFVNERKDGTTYVEDQTISPVWDENGKITHFVSTGRDITERMQREEELRQAKRLFERVAEESPVSILIVQDGVYEYVNPAYEELSGYTRDELVGKLGPTDLVHPDRKDDLNADFARMSGNDTGRTQDETRLIRKDGESRPIRVYRSVVQFEGRESVMAVMVDISEEVRQREARQEIRREIEQASEMKSALLQNMSHEIRTPLASIIGFADLLEGQLQETDMETEFAELIQNSGERLLDTLDNILRLAEIAGDEAEPQIEEVDASDLVRTVIDSCRIRAKEKDLDLVVTLPDEPVKARIDPGAVNQILSNLLDNALKFTRDGRVEIALTPEEEEELRFRIIDTGIGMDSSEIDRLLEPFRQRSVGLAREYEGTGLGLTIAHKLTDRNGGHLDVESEPEEGTTVTVRLPRWAGDPPRGPAHEWGLGSLPGEQRILAVDDDPSLLDLLAEMLPDSYEIDTVTTPDEALERAETEQYDLIFLDINLKDELDGTDLLDRMRDMDAAQHALMIAITAYAMPGDGDRFREQGFDGYVPKPFTYDTLRENLIQVFE